VASGGKWAISSWKVSVYQWAPAVPLFCASPADASAGPGRLPGNVAAALSTVNGV
jgi:hypothetical protein